MTDQNPSAALGKTGLPAVESAGQGCAVASDDANGQACCRATEAEKTLRQPLIRYAAHLLGGDVGLGQDVAQDAFEKLLRKPPDDLAEMTDGRLKAWLFTVCRNRALDVRRKERRMTALPTHTFDRQHEAAPGPAETAQTRDTLSAVLRRLAALPANQQEVIRLRFQGGLTYPEIAEVTGLTNSNVGYLLHHGLKTLRMQMGEVKTATDHT